MSQSQVKASRRNLRRVVSASGVEMLDELLIRVGKLEARCEALEGLARLQKERREVLEARLDAEQRERVAVQSQVNGWADAFHRLTVWDRLRWLVAGR